MLTENFVNDMLQALARLKDLPFASESETAEVQFILDMCQELGMQAYLNGIEEGVNMAISAAGIERDQPPPMPHFVHPDNSN